jgi:ACS family hexuronate transporter-like MFS transporter
MSSDLFRRSEVATVAGMAGTFGNAGVLVFTLVVGALVAHIGYSPFFVVLSILDIIGAIVLWTLVREPPAHRSSTDSVVATQSGPAGAGA